MFIMHTFARSTLARAAGDATSPLRVPSARRITHAILFCRLLAAFLLLPLLPLLSLPLLLLLLLLLPFALHEVCNLATQKNAAMQSFLQGLADCTEQEF